ncbi:MAG: Transposase [Candidatus Nomurabacteria bacterium GW2011_GWB1_37_5]|uniref:Transposase n=1 Tax=Candidatus Nomurabacteria bacterium GW2011_GWB1_37_5 TaxID=1618742 RepID=A0A0G0K0Y5_9BACT|nr:MAG: Transposase [Candidatus Nomurabacteria bacterium GW2011_GWB1_37_5]
MFMLRKVPLELGEYYHVYNRGIERRTIYLSHLDHSRFMLLLYLCNTTENIQLNQILNRIKRNKEKDGNKIDQNDILELYNIPKKDELVSICSYCLMPNHFHIILKEIKEGGISSFMQKLLTSYSMYFNIKNTRSGSLFMKPFRSKHINDDNYFRYLLGYIHLNPVKLIDPKWRNDRLTDVNKIHDYLSNYKYSSLYEFSKNGNSRPESVIINKKSLPNYFKNDLEFNDFINYWLEYSRKYKKEAFFD